MALYKNTATMDIDTEILLPVFVDDSLEISHLEYTMVAAQAHFGQDGSGHYRSAMRMQSVAATGRALRWLLTDDWSRPQAFWDLPAWFCQNINLVWVVRTDQLNLHVPGIALHENAVMQDMLQTMLSNQDAKEART